VSIEVALTDELRKIDEANEEVKQCAEELCNFILSPSLLDDYITFEKLLTKFQTKVTTLVEATTFPNLLVQQLQTQTGQPTQPTQPAQPLLQPPSDFTLEKAIVCLVSIVACGIAVEQRLLPALSIFFVIGVCLAFAFSKQLKGVVEAILKREAEEEEEIAPEYMMDWVNETIAEMRIQYMSTRFITKVQTQTKETLPPQYKDLGLDEALVSRKQLSKETLPHYFNSQIGRIVVECNKCARRQKDLIVSGLVQAQAISLRM
jgi:hypothetical protein